MSSIDSHDSDDDLMMFTMDPLNTLDEEEDSRPRSMSDLSTSDYHSFVATSDTSLLAGSPPVDSHEPVELKPNMKKMCDIADLLGPSSVSADQHADQNSIVDTNESDWFQKLDQQLPVSSSSPSLSVVDYLRARVVQHDQEAYEKYQWQMEQNHLKHGSKQLSPSDYVARTSLYNRPVAFEKDSRSWARSLLDNFKKPINDDEIKPFSKSEVMAVPNPPAVRAPPVNCAYYLPAISNSSSFNHHVQYVEHLNECNDYPGYLQYLQENRSQLFYTLTDSLDIIDGLLGTVVSSF